MAHKISEYEGTPGVDTFLTGGRLNRLEIRAYLGQKRKLYEGAFATDDGIVAYKKKGMEAAFKIKAGRQ